LIFRQCRLQRSVISGRHYKRTGGVINRKPVILHSLIKIFPKNPASPIWYKRFVVGRRSCAKRIKETENHVECLRAQKEEINMKKIT